MAVTTTSACAWTASSNAAWLTITSGGSDDKIDKAKALGADEVINHSREKVNQRVRELTQRRGVEVLPPDVNISNDLFTPAGNSIRFGLVAIKGLGQSAVGSILDARREGGPFKSLFDFCARIDLRLVNRRVLESLIRVGALNAIGDGRQALLSRWIADGDRGPALEVGRGRRGLRRSDQDLRHERRDDRREPEHDRGLVVEQLRGLAQHAGPVPDPRPQPHLTMFGPSQGRSAGPARRR